MTTGVCTLDCTAAGGSVITLPPDIEWNDEGAWMPVAQVVTVSITGAQIVQVGAVQSGRPITLAANGDQHVWLTYGDVETLRAAAAANLSTAMTLTLYDGRSFQVLWRHQDKAVEFTSVEYILGDAAFNLTRRYTLTLRFMQA